MDAQFYAVKVQIGGRERVLVCNLAAAAEIHKTTGRNPLGGGALFVAADGGFCSPSDLAAIMAALLRKFEPHVTAESLLDEMEMCKLPEYLEAVARVIAGPDFGKQSDEPTANPPQANAQ